jgi:hypothetical protein
LPLVVVQVVLVVIVALSLASLLVAAQMQRLR